VVALVGRAPVARLSARPRPTGAHAQDPAARAAQAGGPPRHADVHGPRACARHGTGTLSAVLTGSGTALTVIGVIVVGRRRGWTARPAEAENAPERRAGTAPRVLAFYAVAAAIAWSSAC
jgi:hypothetical protein